MKRLPILIGALCLLSAVIGVFIWRIGIRQPSFPAALKKPIVVPPKPDPWKLVCEDPQSPTPVLLWNGRLGVHIGRSGCSDGDDPSLSLMFRIDDYETSGEERIRHSNTPIHLSFDPPFDAKRVKDYRQELDMRSGLLTTRWKSADAKGKKLDIETEWVIHPLSAMIGVRVRVSGEGAKAFRPTVMEPEKAQVQILTEDSGENFVWVARIAAQGLNQREPMPRFEQLESETRAIWANRWKTDVVIDGPVEDQQAVRSFLFYLRSAIHPEGGKAISPFGLSQDRYWGHVFWDADIWVFPALVLVDPAIAAAIPFYRLQRLNKAREYARAVKPNQTGSVRFPWESSVSGAEVAPLEFRKEIHISGSVMWMLQQAAWLGIAKQNKVNEVGRSVAAMFRDLATDPGGGKPLELRGVMSPDEHHTGDNDLYTNLLAQWTSDRYAKARDRYKIPMDGTSLLTYDNDSLRGYKQAAAVLSIYPLQNPVAEQQARIMMERFAPKVIKNGPAMTDSVHALIWARLNELGRAYDTWKDSWIPFTRNPFMLFSEKRSKEETYFTTGAAGCLQTVLFGFLGCRLDEKPDPDAQWKQKLANDGWLTIRPNLPKLWKSVRFTNFSVLDKHFTLTATHDRVQVTQGEP